MNMNGWDTISTISVDQVNDQLKQRLDQVVMTFSTNWDDGFAGRFSAEGNFDPWSIVGGSDTVIQMRLPIKSGTLQPSGGSGKSTDVSGMDVVVEINLEWVPSAVMPGVKVLRFALAAVTPTGQTRRADQISVISVSDPSKTGFGREVGQGIANALLDSKDKITFVFAETGIVDTQTATWMLPKQSRYSYHVQSGSSTAYLAVLSVTTDRDISALNANIDSDLVSADHPLSIAISGDLFMQNVILPALPGAFPGSNAGSFYCSGSHIGLQHSFDTSSIREGAIDYTPTIDSLGIDININALKNTVSGHCYLHMPNADLDFSVTTNNVMVYDAANQTFSFQKDPNPVSSSEKHVPWYDYLLGLGPLGAAIIAIVMASVESGLSDSLSGSHLAGSLSAAPASTVKWPGLDDITVRTGELNDCILLRADAA